MGTDRQGLRGGGVEEGRMQKMGRGWVEKLSQGRKGAQVFNLHHPPSFFASPPRPFHLCQLRVSITLVLHARTCKKEACAEDTFSKCRTGNYVLLSFSVGRGTPIQKEFFWGKGLLLI